MQIGEGEKREQIGRGVKQGAGFPPAALPSSPRGSENPGSIPNPGVYSPLVTAEMFKCFPGWDSAGIFSFYGAFGNPREGFFILGRATGTSRMGQIPGGFPGSPGEGKVLGMRKSRAGASELYMEI